MSTKLVPIEFDGQMMQFNDDGWFNATVAGAKFGKEPYEWLRLPETERYMGALNRRHEQTGIIPVWFKAKRGGKTPGTWLHPKLAVLFARWCSVDFAVWCDEQIDNILRGAAPTVPELAPGFKVMSRILQESRKFDGKETKFYHYVNEARLVNWALSGKFEAIDRVGLTPSDKILMAGLQEQNTVLIGRGFGYEQRKAMLEQYAADLKAAGQLLR